MTDVLAQQNYIVNNLLMKAIIGILSILVLVACDQLIPIPKTPYGFSIGDPNGSLHIEAVLDFQCPDSKNSYNVLKNVMKTIDFAAKKIKFTYQIMPLPFHFYAFKLHQAFFFVQANSTPENALKLTDYFFDHQDQFTEEVLMDYTIDDFLNQLSALVASITKVNQKALRAELAADTQTHDVARYHWKYSVGVYGVSGAPLFFANSILIDGAEDYGYTDWVDFLKKYIS